MNSFDIFYLTSYIGMMSGLVYYALNYLKSSLNNNIPDFDYFLPNFSSENNGDDSFFIDFINKHNIVNKNVGIIVDSSPSTFFLLSLVKYNYFQNDIYVINTSNNDDVWSDYMANVCEANGLIFVNDVYNSLSNYDGLSYELLLQKYNSTVLAGLNLDTCFLPHNNDYFCEKMIDTLLCEGKFNHKQHFNVNNVHFYYPLWSSKKSIINNLVEQYNFNCNYELVTPESEYFNYLDMDNNKWRTNLFKLYLEKRSKDDELNDDIDEIFSTQKVLDNGCYIKLGTLDHIPIWLLEMVLRKLNIMFDVKTLGELFNVINNTESVNGDFNEEYKYYYSNGLLVFYKNNVVFPEDFDESKWEELKDIILVNSINDNNIDDID